MKDNDVVILDASRTPIGAFSGALSDVPASHLGACLIQTMLKRKGISPEHIDEVIIGQVLTAGCGQNPARQTALASGLPESVPAFTLNKVCGSGLKAVHLASLTIRSGEADMIIAGGQETMSLSPHLLPASRKGKRMGGWEMTDSMVNDGLTDAFHQYHMGQTAENIAREYHITRDAQDEFALHSQKKAAAAQQSGKLASEIVSVRVKKGKETLIFCEDEFPRPATTFETLSRLRPAFLKDGTVTAGNASGVNDGAAMLILASARKARELGITPLCTLKGVSTTGVSPTLMGTGPVSASRKALNAAGWGINELDLIEANEAFAAQAIAVNQAMEWDLNKVNVNGGAIAFGHPIGASGARILVSLIHEMQRQKLHKGLATLCIGGGMGIAATVEMP